MTGVLQIGWQWGEPGWFVLLVPALWLILRRERRRRPLPLVGWDLLAAGRPGGRSPDRLPRTLRQRLVRLPAIVEALGLLLLVAALARPVEVHRAPPSRLGRDLMLCLDRSSSMAAEDLAPGTARLEVGKRLAAEFVAARPDDRIGCVGFARYADLVCPPTPDHAALLELLGALARVAPDGPEDATAIGAAVAAAARMLDAGAGHDPAKRATGGKVVVLLTDGEENVAVAGADGEIPPAVAAEWCRQHGVRVHGVALGRRGDGGEAIDTTAVQQLAERTGGRFFRAGDAAELASVYRDIDRLEAARYAPPEVVVVEWFPVLVLPALLAWLVAVLWLRSPWGGLP